jgi:hypothetical protein
VRRHPSTPAPSKKHAENRKRQIRKTPSTNQRAAMKHEPPIDIEETPNKYDDGNPLQPSGFLGFAVILLALLLIANWLFA